MRIIFFTPLLTACSKADLTGIRANGPCIIQALLKGRYPERVAPCVFPAVHHNKQVVSRIGYASYGL